MCETWFLDPRDNHTKRSKPEEKLLVLLALLCRTLRAFLRPSSRKRQQSLALACQFNAIGMVLFSPLNELHKKAEKLQKGGNVALLALRGDFLSFL